MLFVIFCNLYTVIISDIYAKHNQLQNLRLTYVEILHASQNPRLQPALNASFETFFFLPQLPINSCPFCSLCCYGFSMHCLCCLLAYFGTEILLWFISWFAPEPGEMEGQLPRAGKPEQSGLIKGA